MTRIAELKEEIEVVRAQLDSAAVNGLNDKDFYELSIKLDELIAMYIDEEK